METDNDLLRVLGCLDVKLGLFALVGSFLDGLLLITFTARLLVLGLDCLAGDCFCSFNVCDFLTGTGLIDLGLSDVKDLSGDFDLEAGL